MKNLHIVVLAKQVPDTRNVGPDAMKPDGTVNRSALPAIFNPDDLHALELALQLKDEIPGTKVTVLTMGPKRAADIIREGYFRGADNGIMVSDRRFGGADTLATSYTIAMAIKKIGNVDLVVGGVQAIDGDTAQTGPQTAEKIEFPQVTYVEEVVGISDDKLTLKRRLEKGVETVKTTLPVLLTVAGSSKECRPRIAQKTLKYKYARTNTELGREKDFIQEIVNNKDYLLIPEWSVEDINADLEKIGLPGSPTKVKSVENIVLTVKESKILDSKDESIKEMINDLINAHIIG
ncbi:MAG TPA: electron transfer flavoprotein beta subunit/FixA family protein [Bacteroidetes bacterium]|nr:electron transfer flavoprotein beta subunit/FixA family protein [Bacteroidota bacterium]